MGSTEFCVFRTAETTLRNSVLDMGYDLSKMGSYTRVSEPVIAPKEVAKRTKVQIEGVDNQTVVEYMNNMNAKDFNALINLFTEDGALQPPFQRPIVGKEAVLRFFNEECQNLKLFCLMPLSIISALYGNWMKNIGAIL